MAKSVYIKPIFLKSLIFRAFGFQNCRQGSVSLNDRGGGAALGGEPTRLGGVCWGRADSLPAGVSPQAEGEGRKQDLEAL